MFRGVKALVNLEPGSHELVIRCAALTSVSTHVVRGRRGAATSSAPRRCDGTGRQPWGASLGMVPRRLWVPGVRSPLPAAAVGGMPSGDVLVGEQGDRPG
jgi:hypothetical protein